MTIRAQTLCRTAGDGTYTLDLTPARAGGRVPCLDGTLYVEGIFDGASVAVRIRGFEDWHDVEGSPFTQAAVARIDAHVTGIGAVVSGAGVETAVSVALLGDLVPLVEDGE
jgi:hypothetical protein